MTFLMRLMYVILCISNGMALLRHPPRSMHLRTSLDSSTEVLGDLQQSFQTLQAFNNQCQHLVMQSLKRFGGEATGGNQYYSHVKEQMGDWIDQSILEEVRLTLNDTSLQTATTFANYLLSSPLPAASTIITDEHFTLTLLFVPPATEAELLTHPPGTVILYKSVYGMGELKGFNNVRVIQRDTMNPHTYEEKGTPVITRLGGPRRTLACGIGGISGEESVLSASSTNSGNENELKRFTLIQPPKDELDKLFESSIEVERRGMEMVAKSALFSANAEKYDVFERLRYRVGGLSTELSEIVRRVLSSRQIAPGILRTLGISHVRGILLYGPPGTGKTLIAREISKALNSREPILVNGPEIMDKYVGEAERNIRDLFVSAEEEWEAKGAESELHVVIFDEFDAIAKRRGSLSGDGSGVRDSCVNQLLSKLDGVNEMNNILVIALTNRKDLIDAALLRPGRLEVHVEIQLPDIDGREEILFILLKPLVQGGFVTRQEAIQWCHDLAKRTFGWTGADLSGMMRNAASYAIDRSLTMAKIPSSSTTSSNSGLTAAGVSGGGGGSGDSLLTIGDVKIIWGDVYQAYVESSRNIEVSKRLRIQSYLQRKVKQVQQLLPSAITRGGNKNQATTKRLKRSFDEILQANDEDFIDYREKPVEKELTPEELEWKAIGGNIGGTKVSNISPGNVGGTLIF